jgi:ferric-dicitrate binding protein FerR (iron transport regulator)
MSLPDHELLELNALCNALTDGAITEPERARLEEMLAASDDARRFYVRAMALSASLLDYAGEMQADAPDLPAKRVVRVPAWAWTVGSLAAAACVALAFWLGGFEKRDAAGEIASAEQESDDSVARLSGARACRWAGAALQPGAELRRGQRIELQSGVAEITFDSGAQVTLEGPASLDLGSAWDAVLHRGTLKANVPPEAIGFRVSNPSVEVVDLGTEFSMIADESGATEVFVLQGAVETSARDAAGNNLDSVILREKQARRFTRAGGSDVPDRDAKLAKFARKLPLERYLRPANFVHWSFDEEAGPAFAQSIGSAEADFTARLEPAAAALSAGTRTAGRWERALLLDGSTFAKADFPGIGKRAARTVAFWINVPADAPLPDAGAMLAWPGGHGRGCEIGWNRHPLDGALGTLRTAAGRTSIVGSAPLRDGRWHHVAVVFSPRQKAEGALQIRQYVDGRLDGSTARRSVKRGRNAAHKDAATSMSDEVLWIGRNLAGSDSAAHFRGALDEVFIADRALSPPEIRHLMKQNRPLAPETLAVE